jgi:hypothetical protein
MWAVCVYLEAISVLPQLRMMQNSKVVERFTAHYVFCLGLSRFFSCAHWILQVGHPGGAGRGEDAAARLRTARAGGAAASASAQPLPALAPTRGHPPSPPQLLDGNKYLLTALGSGLWPVMVLLSEVVQTFILADFWWAGGGGRGDGRGGGPQDDAVLTLSPSRSPPLTLPPTSPPPARLAASTTSSRTRTARASCACPSALFDPRAARRARIPGLAAGRAPRSPRPRRFRPSRALGASLADR